MKLALFTNEFPPHIYGGAGIHVDFLSRELKKEMDVEVHCFGKQENIDESISITGHLASTAFDNAASIFQTLERDLQFSAQTKEADIIHCHTWYSHLAGLLSKQLLQAPLIVTTHSLEPHRPWKREQLGNAYDLSTWIERTAYEQADGVIAVSEGMKKDVVEVYGIDPNKVKVIHNGIDLEFYSPRRDEKIVEKHGINPHKPFILFVGRITRQKGITELLKVIPLLDDDIQVVLCAGAPDTPKIAQEMKQSFELVSSQRDGVFWIEEMLPHEELRYLYTHATAFACPSVYEPFGIINLEAMACGTPVVGSHVGGIPEIIIEGETGYLIPFKLKDGEGFTLANPQEFHQNFANKLNTLCNSPELCQKMSIASRKRVEDNFCWKSIAKKTIAFYKETLEKRK